MKRERMRRLVGFRNIIVHEYGEVDVERVRRVVEAGSYVRVAEIVKRLNDELRRRGLLEP
ncbi:MAG: HepT-like ribonuclease domain-containing protein [Pyrobaculum sp.]